MIYKNTDPNVLLAMERERTGNYGEDSSVVFNCIECGRRVYIDEDEHYPLCRKCFCTQENNEL